MNSITDNAPAPDLSFPAPPPAPEPAPPPKHLPDDLKVENKSQAQRLARHMFGPLARVRFIDEFDAQINGDAFWVVEINGGLLLGSSNDLKEALENAAINVASMRADGKGVQGVLQDGSINTVLRRRYDLLSRLPHHYAKDEQRGVVEGIFGAHDHELFEIERLTKETTEGKLEARELAAIVLKKVLNTGAARYHAEQKKRQRN